MRRVFCLASSSLVTLTLAACSSSSGSGFQTLGGADTGTTHIGSDGGVGRDTGTIQTSPMDSSMLMQKGFDSSTPPADGSVVTTTTTTIYAHTDTELYSMDPNTNALTDIGTFSGTSGSYYDSTITDLAVDAAGDIYVNSEIEVYKVTLPATPGAGAKVALTPFVNTSPGLKDGGEPTEKFYALAFAPAGAIGVSTLPTGETLVAGDSKGEIWVIQANGTPVDVGNFGTDPNIAANFLALSGDLVFYTDSAGAATGLATIRSCPTSDPTKCVKTDDYLAGIDMASLKANAAAPTGTLASLLGGIYGGTTTTDGPGTGKPEIFGLGAWQGNVYGFARCYDCYDGGTGTSPAALLKIDTSSGAASVLNASFPFTDGWSGAGVTTKVTVTVTAPPPTMPPTSK